MRLRPLGVFMNGRLEQGLEVELERVANKQRIVTISASSARPQPFILSPAFCNAHSHLEYRGLQGALPPMEYWPWLRELTKVKAKESMDEVLAATHLAARENRATGVAMIAEHSDRPYAAEALEKVGIFGTIFQELITFAEQVAPEMKRILVEAKRVQQQAQSTTCIVRTAPHAPWTVDESTLKQFTKGSVYSMHVAESPHESEFFLNGAGPIADLFRNSGFRVRKVGARVGEYLRGLGLMHPGAQWVHCCALTPREIVMMAEAEVSVAHCPRSNLALNCPPAHVRRMWDAGCQVGLGLDSPASSGPIDMFAEMRAALQISHELNEPLPSELIWAMASSAGAKSIGVAGWEIREGNLLELIAVRAEAADLDRVIELGVPADVHWLSEAVEA